MCRVCAVNHRVICLPSPADAGRAAGAEGSGGSGLPDAGAQSARVTEPGGAGRPAVRLHRPHDELHLTGQPANTATL